MADEPEAQEVKDAPVRSVHQRMRDRRFAEANDNWKITQEDFRQLARTGEFTPAPAEQP